MRRKQSELRNLRGGMIHFMTIHAEAPKYRILCKLGQKNVIEDGDGASIREHEVDCPDCLKAMEARAE